MQVLSDEWLRRNEDAMKYYAGILKTLIWNSDKHFLSECVYVSKTDRQ